MTQEGDSEELPAKITVPGVEASDRVVLFTPVSNVVRAIGFVGNEHIQNCLRFGQHEGYKFRIVRIADCTLEQLKLVTRWYAVEALNGALEAFDEELHRAITCNDFLRIREIVMAIHEYDPWMRTVPEVAEMVLVRYYQIQPTPSDDSEEDDEAVWAMEGNIAEQTGKALAAALFPSRSKSSGISD